MKISHKISSTSFSVLPIVSSLASWAVMLSFVAIFVVLAVESWFFFQKVAAAEFFFTTVWQPFFDPKQFGVWPLVTGTCLIAIIAGIFAIPFGTACAFFISSLHSRKGKNLCRMFLDILVGIPSVVFGYFALNSMTPFLKHLLPEIGYFNALSAGLVVGLMILPIITSVALDSFESCSQQQKQAASSLGMFPSETFWAIVFPQSLSGLGSAYILGLARAVGETMAVTLAAGSSPEMTLNPLSSIQTMTAYIVQASMGESQHTSPAFTSIFAVGFGLLIICFVMNTLGIWFRTLQKSQ